MGQGLRNNLRSLVSKVLNPSFPSLCSQTDILRGGMTAELLLGDIACWKAALHTHFRGEPVPGMGGLVVTALHLNSGDVGSVLALLQTPCMTLYQSLNLFVPLFPVCVMS